MATTSRRSAPTPCCPLSARPGRKPDEHPHPLPRAQAGLSPDSAADDSGRACVLLMENGKRLRLAVKQVLEKSFCRVAYHELGAVDFPCDTKTWYKLRVENEGPKISAYVDGKLMISAENDEIPSGKVGVIAACPARFTDFRATTPSPEEITKRIRARAEQEKKLQDENPRPKLWRKFETPQFGAG